MSAYCKTSLSQSRGTTAARIVEQRIQVGLMHSLGTAALRGMRSKDETEVLTRNCMESEQSGQAGV